MNNRDLFIRPSITSLLEGATQQVIALETELARETARRIELERLLTVTTLAIAERGGLDIHGLVALHKDDAVGHA